MGDASVILQSAVERSSTFSFSHQCSRHGTVYVCRSIDFAATTSIIRRRFLSIFFSCNHFPFSESVRCGKWGSHRSKRLSFIQSETVFYFSWMRIVQFHLEYIPSPSSFDSLLYAVVVIVVDIRLLLDIFFIMLGWMEALRTHSGVFDKFMLCVYCVCFVRSRW